MFEGFERRTVSVDGVDIACVVGGSGPPVLMLHGFPQNRAMWARVAPRLADRFTVVCADLRGYGDSAKPKCAADRSNYAFRALAADQLGLMAGLGFEHFHVVGHDRGGRTGHRMALDHPDRVAQLAVLDIIPTGEAFGRADARLALGYWPWVLLAQPEPLPERLVAADPEAVVDDALGGWGTERASFPAELREAYVAALRDGASVHAICEEYRAAATLDVAEDDEDRRVDRRIACPVLALWGARGPLDTWYQDAGGPLGIWRLWAGDVRGRAIAGGHFFPEQNAAETIAELRAFFGA